MTQDDSDCRTVLALTAEWLACLASRNVRRVDEILANDFVHTQHPSSGGQTITRSQMLAMMENIVKSEAKILSQDVRRSDDVITVMSVFEASQTVSEKQGELSPPLEQSFPMKRMLDASGWRRERGSWRCFDYRLIAVLDI